MTQLQRVGVSGLCLLMAAGLVIGVLRAAGGGTAARPAQTSKRSVEQINKDVGAIDQQIAMIMPSPREMVEVGFRAQVGPKLLPLMKRSVMLLQEFENALAGDPDYKDMAELRDDIRGVRQLNTVFVAALGDKETQSALEAKSKGSEAEAAVAKASLALEAWVLAPRDAASQEKVLEQFATVAQQNSSSSDVATMLGMTVNLGPVNNDVIKKITEIVRTNLKSDNAKAILAGLDSIQERYAMIGKPLPISGRTSKGGTFSSEEYKGKVVLIDFCATWCVPCIGEIPNVKKAYAAYHSKGLEIIGVSCDDDDESLNKFVQEKDIPWVQLREQSQTFVDHWHPVAKQLHVEGIPAMFLMDRKGMLRYIDAREDLDKKIAELIAEGGGATQPAAK